jgi:hypothetical protein
MAVASRIDGAPDPDRVREGRVYRGGKQNREASASFLKKRSKKLLI